MKDIRSLHEEAMDVALQGDIAVSQGKNDDAQSFYEEAFEKEREAALLAAYLNNPEPGLSILYRSAASLAMQCGRFREGEQLIAKALSGNPTPEIAKELRNLLQQIYASSGKESDVVTYEVQIRPEDSSKIEILLKQFGESVRAIYKSVGSIAL